MDIAAIIVGLITVATALLPRLSVLQRITAFFGGAGFAVYGIYVLNQDSGTWTFPLFLYLLPIVIIGNSFTANRRHNAD